MDPLTLEWGSALEALDASPRSGDLAVVEEWEGGALVGAIDGLGHGAEAEVAARMAEKVLRAAPADGPAVLVRRCHAALTRTRGVVMTLARIDLLTGELIWCGVGNVEARLLRAGGRPGVGGHSPVLFGGVVGYTLPDFIRESSLPLGPGDTLIMATDGVRSDFVTGLTAGPRPQELADAVLAKSARGGDDALVVCARVMATW